MEYNKELESQLLGNDAILFTTMAEIEVRCIKGKPFIKDMVESTGLTRDQIRHRRSKPIYNDYIELAKRNKALSKEPRATLTGLGAPTQCSPDDRRNFRFCLDPAGAGCHPAQGASYN